MQPSPTQNYCQQQRMWFSTTFRWLTMTKLTVFKWVWDLGSHDYRPRAFIETLSSIPSVSCMISECFPFQRPSTNAVVWEKVRSEINIVLSLTELLWLIMNLVMIATERRGKKLLTGYQSFLSQLSRRRPCIINHPNKNPTTRTYN
jgi:hypothetical protein